VADHSYHLSFKSELHDANCVHEVTLWAFQARCEMCWLVAASERVIADSRGLMAEADRMLARRW
jgi:hypothetical protein